MNQDAIKEIAKQLGVGANYLAEHLVDFAPQWGMFKAIQDLAGVLPMGFILAPILTAFGLVALVIFGCFAIDAVTHLAVPQAAMINDMLGMVQQ